MTDKVSGLDDVVVEADHITQLFDVSSPWLTRLLEHKPRQILRAVDDVSFTIRRGQTLALVGESGCGKSTLARVLAGLYRPSSGAVRLFNEDVYGVSAADHEAIRRRVNMIFQDPYASLNPRWSIFDIVAEPLRVQQPELSAQDVNERVQTVIQLVRLPQQALGKYPHQFSGGQRQRISIARALTSRPEFLICDEPTSALDVSVQAQVLNLMKEVQQQVGMTYLFISHNLAVVHHMSDQVGVMYLGRLVELADKEDLFTRPLHPYTQMLLAAIPTMRGRTQERQSIAGEVPSALNPPAGCTFHPRCPMATDICRCQVPQVRVIRTEQGSTRCVACHLNAL